jgi:hypothetical protein
MALHRLFFASPPVLGTAVTEMSRHLTLVEVGWPLPYEIVRLIHVHRYFPSSLANLELRMSSATMSVGLKILMDLRCAF